MNQTLRVPAEDLRSFIARSFEKVGMPLVFGLLAGELGIEKLAWP